MTTQNLTSRDVTGMMFHGLAQADLSDGWPQTISGNPINDSRGYIKPVYTDSAGGMRRMRLPRAEHRVRTYEYEVVADKFEATVNVPIDDLSRDQTGMLRRRIDEQITQPVSTHWNELCTETITSNVLGPDGKAMFAADHEQGESGAQSNIYTLDITDPTKPDASNIEDIVWAAWEGMTQLKNDAARPAVYADRFMLMVPPKYMKPTLVALRAETIADGAVLRQNTLGSSVNSEFSVSIVSNRWLPSTNNDMYLFAEDGRSLIRLTEFEARPKKKAEGSDFEFDNREHVYGVERAVGVAPWHWPSAAKLSFT